MSIRETEALMLTSRVVYYSGLFFMAVYAFQLTGEL